MTHQCLNCGKTIVKGSDEILKGCQQCGGKKFIFVSSPLPEERRMDLLKQAESVRADLVRKADPELLRVLRERGMTEVEGSTLEIEPSPSGDWLRVRPKLEPTQLPKPPSRPVPKAIIEREGPVEVAPRKPSAKEIIFEYDREHLAKGPSSSGPDRPVRSARKPQGKKVAKPKKRVLKGGRNKDDVKKKRKGPPPLGTVNVIEKGVYEIDIERLLRDDPIIIEDDGTYLIHLPSLIKEGSDARGKRGK
ncbi:MAG: hypothetical protein MUC62_08685 [Candidatus Thermoplasmatota archaeon]|nr:hypothetical protein [Candidatus Thermoplasmatota archaeon]